MWGQLRTCFDPEIPVNIVDLGLIYDCSLSDPDDAGQRQADVKMTLTAPGCGMGQVLADDVKRKVEAPAGDRGGRGRGGLRPAVEPQHDDRGGEAAAGNVLSR